LAQYNAVLASASTVIKFFNLDDFDEPIVINNTEVHLNTTLPGKYLCDIAVSEEDLVSHMKVIAMGDRSGRIQIWRVNDLHLNIPCATIKYESQVFDIDLV